MYLSAWKTRTAESCQRFAIRFITKTLLVLYSVLQNDILTDNTHTVEIKVDPPADGNAANTENSASGNYSVQSVRLFVLNPILNISIYNISQDLNIKKNECANISAVKIWSLKIIPVSTISSMVC